MKKAFLDQFLLGFILVMGVFTFVATVSDESNTKDKVFALKDTAFKSTQSMGIHYGNTLDMCEAERINKNILRQSKLGSEILSKGALDITWWDTDADGQPDSVSTNISQVEHPTFWYKFFGKDSFTIGPFNNQQPFTVPMETTISYWQRPNAGFKNSMGTYELDENNCVKNMQMHLADSKDTNKWIDGNGNGKVIADKIHTPPKRIFFIADGFRHFNEPSDNEPITLEEPHCFGANEYPEITMNGVTKQADVGNAYTGNVFFEDVELNPDGYEHMHIIPEEAMDAYNYYKSNVHQSGGTEKDKYEAFKRYVDNVLNQDSDPNNDIDYTKSPTDQYKYALEDLDAAQSDFDFSDLLLDSVRKPLQNTANNYTVNDDGSIDLEGCDDDNNTQPTLTLGGCPVTMDENTSTSQITWVANDPDGTITRKEANANNGNAVVNENGTITYTPNQNFDGTDVVTMRVKDDNGGTASATCNITVNNVNQPPSINGNPQTEVTAGDNYIFIPSATDPDGDTLSFSIQNKPIWANFDPSTGQLSGQPAHDQIGIFSNIVITVSDGNGGTDSLAFSIEVKKDENNNPPVLQTPFPSPVEVIVGSPYTINALGHFIDPDGDELTYTINIYDNSNNLIQTINASSYTIANVNTPLRVDIIASDGELTATGSFVINTLLYQEFYLFTFDNDKQGWQGNTSDWITYNGDGKLRLRADRTNRYYSTYIDIDFGAVNAGRQIVVEFDAVYRGGWESSGGSKDYLRVSIIPNNNTHTEFFSEGNGSNNSITRTNQEVKDESNVNGKVGSDGQVRIRFSIDVSYTGEYIYLDNIRVRLQ